MAEHQIKMKDDKPIKQRYYPKNPTIQGEINAKVYELLQIHRAFKEPIPLPHRDGEKEDRQVETVCRLQAHQREVSEGMPRINCILDQLREAMYISSLNLKDGYWQIPMEESSRQYTAFTVPCKSLFQWRVMQFGLHLASATFQRVLDQVIGPEMSPHAFAYKRNLREMFRRLKEVNVHVDIVKGHSNRIKRGIGNNNFRRVQLDQGHGRKERDPTAEVLGLRYGW